MVNPKIRMPLQEITRNTIHPVMIEIAKKRGVANIYADNNIRTTVILELLDLRVAEPLEGGGRGGYDAIDNSNNKCEIKTTTSSEFSTSHNMTLNILDRYRKADYWVFALFDKESNNPKELYLAKTEKLERYFSYWEAKCKTFELEGKRFNCPKIPLNYIRSIGFSIDTSTCHILAIQEILKMANSMEKNDEEVAMAVLLEYGEKKLEKHNNFIRNFVDSLSEILNKETVNKLLMASAEKANFNLSFLISPEDIKASHKIELEKEDPSFNGVDKIKSSSAPNEELKHEPFYKFLTSTPRFEITGKSEDFVPDATITNHWQRWYVDNYKQNAPRKNANTSREIYKLLKLNRSEDDRVHGIKLVGSPKANETTMGLFSK
jgi:hypothetical protein